MNHPSIRILGDRLYCLPQLEALIDSIIKRSAGGEA